MSFLLGMPGEQGILMLLDKHHQCIGRRGVFGLARWGHRGGEGATHSIVEGHARERDIVARIDLRNQRALQLHIDFEQVIARGKTGLHQPLGVPVI